MILLRFFIPVILFDIMHLLKKIDLLFSKKY